MEIKTRNLIIGLAIAFVMTFVGGWLTGRYDRNHTSETIINNLNGIIRTYTYTIDDLRKEATEKNALIMSQRQAIAEGLVIKEELRKLKIKHLNDVTYLQTTVDVLLDSISYIQGNAPSDSPCPPDDNHPVLYLPLVFGEQNDYLHLRGEFDESGVLSMDIKLPVNIGMYVGYDKQTKKLKGVATIDNPYISVQDITTIRTDLKPNYKWGVGLMAGYGLVYTEKVMKPAPFIGIGLSRNIIKF